MGVVKLILALVFLQQQLHHRDAAAWYRGDMMVQLELARTIEGWVKADLRREGFATGSAQFDGEWLFGTYMMAAMGFGQSALEHPPLHQRYAELMAHCIDRMIADDVRLFDRESWADDPLANLENGTGHAAYLGYLNLATSLHRLLDPDSRHGTLNDRVTAALVRRISESPTLLIQTYPNETYPVDNCAVIGSIGLYDRATGADHRELLRAWSQHCRQKYVDARTGLLIQAVDSQTGDAVDHPRGSGTALGLYMLSFADPVLSRELYAAARRELTDSYLGWGVVREYPRGVNGLGDIDSGPITFGYGMSATGFMIGGARLFGDRATFQHNVATAHLLGAPARRDGQRVFATGDPLGNAILFAMLTAQPINKGGNR